MLVQANTDRLFVILAFIEKLGSKKPTYPPEAVPSFGTLMDIESRFPLELLEPLTYIGLIDHYGQ